MSTRVPKKQKEGRGRLEEIRKKKDVRKEFLRSEYMKGRGAHNYDIWGVPYHPPGFEFVSVMR